MLESKRVWVSQLNFARGVSTTDISAVVAEDGTGATRVHHLGLLALDKVKADHLLLDSPHQQLCWPLVVPQHALQVKSLYHTSIFQGTNLHFHHVCRVMGEGRQPSPYLTPEGGLRQGQHPSLHRQQAPNCFSGMNLINCESR